MASNDPRNNPLYSLMESPCSGTTPMMRTVWTAIWQRNNRSQSLVIDARRGTPFLISNHIGILKDRWVHVCEPRNIYNLIKHSYEGAWRESTKNKDCPKHKEYNLKLYCKSEANRSFIEVLVNDCFVPGFNKDIGWGVDYQIEWNNYMKDMTCRHWGCGYQLTKSDRAKLQIMNIGGE